MFAFAGDFYGKTRSIKLINIHIKIVFNIIFILTMVNSMSNHMNISHE